MDVLIHIAGYIPSKPYVFIISIISFWVFLWFSLFISLQRPRNQLTILASFFTLTLSIFIAGSILQANSNTLGAYILFNKLYLGSACFPAILWLHLTLVLLKQQTKNAGSLIIFEKPFSIAKLNKIIRSFFDDLSIFSLLGLLLFHGIAILSAYSVFATNLLFDYNNIKLAEWPFSKWSKFNFSDGQYYLIFSIYIVLCMIWATSNGVKAFYNSKIGSIEKKSLTWLMVGTAFFLIGAAILVMTLVFLPFPDEIGLIPLSTGVLIVGYSIASFNALVEGRVIKEKFLSKFWTVFSVLGIFIALYLIMLPQASIIALLVITTFLLIVLTFYENIIDLWEKLFVDKRITQVKKQTKQMVSQLIEINPDEIGSWVEKVKKLSKAELVIMDSIGKGFGRRTSEDVSQELFLSVKTVNTHLKNIRKKLDCRKSSELPLIWLVVNTIENKPESVNLAALATDTPIAES